MDVGGVAAMRSPLELAEALDRIVARRVEATAFWASRLGPTSEAVRSLEYAQATDVMADAAMTLRRMAGEDA